MSDPYQQILEETFFTHTDKGVCAEETPLFLHAQKSRDISSQIAAKHSLSQKQAQSLLNDAFQEVRLS